MAVIEFGNGRRHNVKIYAGLPDDIRHPANDRSRTNYVDRPSRHSRHTHGENVEAMRVLLGDESLLEPSGTADLYDRSFTSDDLRVAMSPDGCFRR